MLLDSGVLTLCRLENTAPGGAMPRMRLVPVERCFYGERTVGYNRQYAALGVNERVDLLARVWQSRAARAGMFALLEDGAQYRVALAQQLWDDNGLRVTDLTLERIDALYDVAGTAENDR